MKLATVFWIGMTAIGCAADAMAQQTPVPYRREKPSVPPLTRVAPGLWRLEGQDAESGLVYVRLLLLAQSLPAAVSGGSPPGADAESAPDLKQPTLTGQCTRDPQGKLRFELFANFGAVPDPAFYPPWRAAGTTELYPPSTEKHMLTMDFLGYTHVKPKTRQFERTLAPGFEQLRYVTPGGNSSNLEPPGWFFQYLRSLPTLRLTDTGHSADFFTTPWLDQMHKEPLCAASGA